MKLAPSLSQRIVIPALGFLSLILPIHAWGEDVKITLSGSQEVPAVKTSATGSGTIVVNSDKTVGGRISTRGIAGTMAHIHSGAPNANGPVVIPLSKSGDGGWSVPPGARLTDEQYQAFKAGNLYVNVHSEAHKGGEIRGQIKP